VEPRNPTYAYVGALVDELVRSGLRHAVICPGSRSTPLAYTFARHAERADLQLWVQLDERSAAFFALGIAKATRAPVALVCTSGTAAANFLPAIAEARLSRAPLVALTADRPHELRDVGAPQAMDQLRLYGTHVKWFVEMALPEAGDVMLRYARVVAARAMATAMAAPAGPVHLNLPFREPLTPDPIPDLPLPETRESLAWRGRDDGRPLVAVHESPQVPPATLLESLAALLAGRERGLIVVGPHDDAELAAPLTELAARLGFPILADPLANLRHGAFDRQLIIDSYDALLRDVDFARTAAPEVVLRIGAPPTSKPLQQYLNAHLAGEQIVVDHGDGWRDPALAAAQLIHAEPRLLAAGLLRHLHGNARVSGWMRRWQAAAARARAALEAEMSRFETLFEGCVFPELAALLPAGATLVVGNSMPIRDCDTFLPGGERPLRVLGNRGVNGIDGLVSTALGVAAAGADPVVLVLGDLSFYHDLNGLLAAKRYGLRLAIVLVNNDGGGIFSFLPQASHPEHFELLFGTPHGLDFEPVVRMYGGDFRRARDWDGFRRALAGALTRDGLSVIEVPTAREANVTMHRRLWQAVSAALHAEGGSA